jgi:magnesium transporter
MMVPSLRQDTLNPRQRFLERRKLFVDPEQAKPLAAKIAGLSAAGQSDAVRTLLNEYYPPDIADVMSFLDDEQDKAVFRLLDAQEAAEVLDEVDDCTKEQLLSVLSPEQVAQRVDPLPSDEATDVVQALKPNEVPLVLKAMDPSRAREVQALMAYPRESAGGIMSLGFVAVPETATTGQALQTFREKTRADPTLNVYVVDSKGTLKGVLDVRQLMSADPALPARDLMVQNLVTVPPQMDREQVARIFARYDLTTLPVVEPPPLNKLLGIVTADDIIDVIEAEDTEDMLRIAGSDAEEMERRSPARTALLRLPWILATMFIELGAGLVIHFYDATLARVLLLASFMPIISAISGNTGLQSATIIVRGLSGGQVQVAQWRRAVLRQLIMTLILGAVTGLVLGTIGALWYGKWTFGLVVFIGMFAAVNIAGIVGTIVPLTSKRLGFDPAITSGPFETAFQDVVGISIFLTLATVLLRYLV